MSNNKFADAGDTDLKSVLIQHIHTLWSKKSRGGAGARVRNSIPRAVVLPKEVVTHANWILHTATYSELNQFAQDDRSKHAERFTDLGIQDLHIEQDKNALIVRYHRDGNNAARTSPLPFSDLPAIDHNTWIRLRYNGRYVHRSTGNWWYEQSCYNIGWFDTIAANVFIATQPISQFEEIAVLR